MADLRPTKEGRTGTRAERAATRAVGQVEAKNPNLYEVSRAFLSLRDFNAATKSAWEHLRVHFDQEPHDV